MVLVVVVSTLVVEPVLVLVSILVVVLVKVVLQHGALATATSQIQPLAQFLQELAAQFLNERMLQAPST